MKKKDEEEKKAEVKEAQKSTRNLRHVGGQRSRYAMIFFFKPKTRYTSYYALVCSEICI